MVDKIDYKKTFKHLYNPPTRDFTLVDVPPINFLMIDGKGEPNPDADTEYAAAVPALFSAAYTIKFAIKKALGIDFTVMPAEGLWWADDMTAFQTRNKANWLWTMMIMQPDAVTAELAYESIAAAQKKKPQPALDKLRFETYHEGLALQIMHIGSYEDETPTLARMHNEYIPQHGYTMTGKHHEIYLGDPRRTAPEKLKTILRQPVAKT